MSIPKLKQRAEFYALCLEHGPQNVEWRWQPEADKWSEHTWSEWLRADKNDIWAWNAAYVFEFRLRPRTVVLPEAVVPEEDPEGQFCFFIQTWNEKPGVSATGPSRRFRTAADRDAVVAAMLAREVKR